jgi:hypothetical protein
MGLDTNLAKRKCVMVTHYLITSTKQAIGVVATCEDDALSQAMAMGIGQQVIRVDVAMTEEEFNNAIDPDYEWNKRFSFDHMERPENEGGFDSEWYWLLLCARHASVFRTYEQPIYCTLEWSHLSEATDAGIIFG